MEAIVSGSRKHIHAIPLPGLQNDQCNTDRWFNFISQIFKNILGCYWKSPITLLLILVPTSPKGCVFDESIVIYSLLNHYFLWSYQNVKLVGKLINIWISQGNILWAILGSKNLPQVRKWKISPRGDRTIKEHIHYNFISRHFPRQTETMIIAAMDVDGIAVIKLLLMTQV